MYMCVRMYAKRIRRSLNTNNKILLQWKIAFVG